MNFTELAAERYSARSYSDRPVEQEKIDAVLHAAMLAPTAKNNQPQKIYVVLSEEKRKMLSENCRCIFGAPVVFVLGYDTERVARGIRRENDEFGETDVAIVCTHMMLKATELGLGSCCVGMFREEEIRACLGIPGNVKITLLLPVGYPDAGPSARHTEFRDSSEIVEYL